MEKDINDIFDDILFTEENLIQESYETGYKEGKNQRYTEGYHLGYHRGAEIGAEVGYYLGVIENLNIESPSEKVQLALATLKTQIQNLPTINSENDILGQLDSIRVGYKKLCAMLKLNSSYPEADQLSF